MDLKPFLDTTLAPILDPATRALFLSEDSMTTWEQAFTAETFSPDFNYADMVSAGQSVLKLLFPLYLMETYPTLQQKDYSNLNMHYMTVEKQSQYAKKLALPDHVQVGDIDREKLDIDADVFRSFFGALFTVGEDILKKRTGRADRSGFGYVSAKKFLQHLFSDVPIDLRYRAGPAKTQVKQLFVRFGLPPPTERVTGGPPVVYTVILETVHRNFLRQYGVDADRIIGEGSSHMKSKAEDEAYDQAHQYLEDRGFTTEWAENEKTRRDFSRLRDARKAQAKLRKEGYVSMYFFAPTKGSQKDGKAMQLIASAPGKPDRVLATIFCRTEQEKRECQSILLEMYLSA